MLPSGEVFALKLPDVEEMIQRKLIPPDLRAIAVKFGASSLKPETMDTEELGKMLRFMRGMVAHMLRYVWNGPTEPIDAWSKFDATRVQPPGNADENFNGWLPITVTLADLEEGSIDGDDYAALQGIATRTLSCAEVTTLSLADRKLISDAEAEQRKADAASESTPGWRSFRGKHGSSEPGDDGGQVARTTDDVPADTDRSGPEVPARRRTASSSARR